MKKGEKFTEKYNVETATIYKATEDTSSLQIPPPQHALYDPTAPRTYDPIRVEAIDRDGKMTTPIEVWTDPDEGILWVLDGRGRLLDVREVNRRREAAGREPVKPYIVPFSGDEKAAIARVREKNYHRRIPTPSGMATDLLAMRNAGHPWDACAKAMHHETEDPEQWGRKLLPLAFCVAEVQAAIDAGELPRTAATKFGGTASDGSKALGKRQQLELLEKLRQEKTMKSEAPFKAPKPLSPKARERAAAALTNGASEKLSKADKAIAEVVVATLGRISGDRRALEEWPAVAAIVDGALTPLSKGPRAKQAAEGEG